MKFMRRWLVPVLLAVGMLLATSSQAATYLSNLSIVADGFFNGSPDSADAFTTGAQPLEVNRVSVRWFNGNGGVNQVGIYTDNAGFPGATRVGTFFTNPNPTVPGVLTYVGSASLAANTTYWMVIDITDGSKVAYTVNAGFVADPGAGGVAMLPGSAFGSIDGSWTSDPSNVNLQYSLGNDLSVPTLSDWSLIILACLIVVATVFVQARSKQAT